MKTKIVSSILLLLNVYISGNAQHTAITTTSKEISNNLDLEAVAYLFGKSQNLEHFEEQINSPHHAISNLDLNRDGYVDYLRVVETNMQNVHTVNIQAVLGNDIYKDIAMIGVQKDFYGKTHVRMIGNEHLYGYKYVINPVYVNKPLLVANFWKPNHKAYHVSYRSHYPVYYTPRVVRTAHAHNKHLNYYATAYYNTNRPTVSYHHSVKPHSNNVKNYKNDKYTKNASHSYSGQQAQNSQAKANKKSHNTTVKQKNRQSNTTVRYTNNTQTQVNTRGQSSNVKTASTSNPRASSTRSNTSTVRKASNSRSESTTRTQQSRSTRSELAMR